MKLFTKTKTFLLLSIVAFWILIFAFFDVIYNKNWMIPVVISFSIILVIIIFFFLLIMFSKDKKTLDSFKEFEETLKGGLFHFKCPECKGIFAIKKSKSNDNCPIKMTCPDCGSVGVIPKKPRIIEEEIPKKKSIKSGFKCNNCGEGVTIWAEGSDLYEDMHVYSCPYCGKEESMYRI